MRILIISQYFYPENFRINQLCLDLKDRGNQITVLTGKPNYPKGEYFDGYSYKGDNDEIWNEIPIIRVPLRARKMGSKNLVLNYLSFIFYANKKIKHLNNNFDIVYVFEVSPITVALPAIKMKKKHNIPIVMNVQDLWPENIIAVTGITNRLIIGYVNKLVNYIYKNCDLLLCASPSFVPRIQEKVKDKSKVEYWPQYATITKCVNESNIFDRTKFNIVFTGNIGEAQGIDIAIETAKELEDYPIHWHFIGDGRRKKHLEELVLKYNLGESVTFYGFKPEDEMPIYLDSADAALLILKPDPVFEMTIPAKLQTYLACGVPIIGCVSGEGKRIIEESNSGIISSEISINGLKKACLEMLNLSNEELEKYKANSFEYGKKEFDKNNLIRSLENKMEELINESIQR